MIVLFTPPLSARDRRGDAPEPATAGALAAHLHGARRPARALLTGLTPTSGGGVCIVRVVARPEARDHLMSLWAHYDDLDRATPAIATPARALFEDAAGRSVVAEAFVAGASVEAAAGRALETGDVSGAARVLAAYRDLLDLAGRTALPGDQQRFVAALGRAAPTADRARWLPGCALDLLPHNLLLAGDRPTAIDLEWALPGPVPVEFVAARGLLVLARREGGLLASNWREAGVPIMDLGGGERLPVELCRALVPDADGLAAWLAAVRHYDAGLQVQVGWHAPWAQPTPQALAPTRVPDARPYPLELLGWSVLRDRVRRDHETLARLEAENARLRRDLSFTAAGLLRRLASRLPWIVQPVRAVSRALFPAPRG